MEDILNLGKIKKSQDRRKNQGAKYDKKLSIFKSTIEGDNGMHSFPIDITRNIKKYSLKLDF